VGTLSATVVLGAALWAPGVSGAHLTRGHHHRHAPRRCVGADVPATAASLDQLRAAVVCLVNQQRTARHLPALHVSPLLNHSAQAWTDVMVATGNFTHGPGNAFALRISAAGYDWQAAAENIATGYPSPRAVVSAWMASPDHCRNILGPSFRDVGTGESPHSVGSFSSGPATWTQDFGLPAGLSAASGNRGPQSGCPY
jgi:uncharacterized protein YkwD